MQGLRSAVMAMSLRLCLCPLGLSLAQQSMGPTPSPMTKAPINESPTQPPTSIEAEDSDRLVIAIVIAGGALFLILVIYNFVKIRHARIARYAQYQGLALLNAPDVPDFIDAEGDGDLDLNDLESIDDIGPETCGIGQSQMTSEMEDNDEVFDDPSTPNKLHVYAAPGSKNPKLRVLSNEL